MSNTQQAVRTTWPTSLGLMITVIAWATPVDLPVRLFCTAVLAFTFGLDITRRARYNRRAHQ